MLTKRLGPCLLALFTLLTFVYQQPAEGYRSLPKEIYHQAWQLVRDNYFESSFNGQAWSTWEHKYDGDLKTVDEAHKAIKVMLDSLKDPYTRFLDPQAFKDENDAIDAKIVGIGINLLQKDNKLIITKTIDGSPAAMSGLVERDEIVAIDGTNTIGFTPEQAAERIRGKAGSPVTITVKRSGLSSYKPVKIVRAEIIIHAVTSRIIDNNIGYIQLSTFISNDAAREFRTALEKLRNTDGLIVDLRDNPGGLLSNSLEIADMLLENGVIVSTVGRHGKNTDMASGMPVTHQPIAILVDEESASASEILAGALQDNARAVVIGTHTYGKGLVQEINRLPGGAALHITVSRYLTPAGTDINKRGILPDIQVSDREQQKNVAMAYLKEKIASLKQPFKTSVLPRSMASTVAGSR